MNKENQCAPSNDRSKHFNRSEAAVRRARRFAAHNENVLRMRVPLGGIPSTTNFVTTAMKNQPLDSHTSQTLSHKAMKALDDLENLLGVDTAKNTDFSDEDKITQRIYALKSVLGKTKDF